MLAQPTAPVRWRSHPGTALASVFGPPARVALAPLAWLLAVIDAVLRRPSLLVVGALLLMCPPSDIQDVSSSGHVTPADLAAGLVIAAVTIRLLTGDRLRGRHGYLPFAFAVTAFAIASITADDPSVSLLGFVRYTELFVLIPVAVAMSLRDRRDILMVAGSLVAVCVFEGGLGVVQALTRTGASYGGQYIRAVGTFGADQVEALGALLGYGIVVTLALGLAVRGRPRVLLLGTAGGLLVPLGLTLSRGSWIATAAAVLIALVVYNWRAALVLGCAVVLALGIMTVRAVESGSAGNERLTSIASVGNDPDQSVQDRYDLWDTAIAMWVDHPIAGVGMKDFAQYRDNYAPMSLSAGSDVATQSAGFHREPLLSPHNQYLMVLAEQGMVGALAFGTLLGTIAFGAVRRRREPSRSRSRTAASTRSATRRGPDNRGDRFTDSPVEHRFLDVAAPAVMAWTLVDFMYGDVGAGPISVLLGILLGLAARRMVIVPRESRA